MSGNCSFILRDTQHPGWSFVSALILLCTGMSFSLSTPGMCSASPVSAAVEFLVSHQDTSGVWSKGTVREKMDTAAAIAALEMNGDAEAEMAQIQARAAVLLQLETDPKTIMDRILALRCDDSADGSALLAARNPDGGWGTAIDQQSDVVDTILAVDALLDRDLAPEEGWDRSVAYLLGTRQPDGFWFFSDESALGKLELTARAVRTLNRLRAQDISTQTDIDQVISTTLPILRETFRSDGRFSLSDDLAMPVSPVATAEVYRTLIQVDQPALYADSLALLESQQSDDGRWSEPDTPEQDVYTTATVLLAFFAVQTAPTSPRADLAVLASAILFNPSSPDVDDTVTMTAIVFNIGEVVATNAEIAFFNGDPRSGGGQLGVTQTVANLQPNGSATASVDLDAGSLATGPIIYVLADPEGRIPESDRTNNIASRLLHVVGLPDAVPMPDVDLFIDSHSISFNDEITDTVFLIGSPVVSIGLLVANLGTESSGAFRVDVLDGAVRIGRITVPALDGAASTAVQIPWLPGSGTRTLTVDIDSEDSVTESDETNNSTSVPVEVIGATCTVAVRKYEQGIEQEPPFSAYDTGRFIVATAYQDADIQLSVTDSSGTPTRSPAMPLYEAGKYQWNVVNHAPGFYTVTATFSASDTGVVLDQASAPFEVIATTALRSIYVSLPKDIVEGGNIQAIPITVTLANGSNVDADWDVSWQVLSPSGTQVAISSAPETVSILGLQMSRTLTLSEEITGSISEAGRHTVIVSASTGGGTAVTGTAYFNLLPPLHLNVTNEVVPDEVAPLGKVRVKTVLRISAAGQTSGLDVPAAITDLTVSPSGNIPDVASSSSTVTASGIINAIGEIVPDGTQMAVYVPYGTIGTGVAAPGTPSNPQIRIVEINDGAAVIPYAPIGGTLTAGQYSLTIMEFHQYYVGEEEWFGKNIGNAEIFLQGQ